MIFASQRICVHIHVNDNLITMLGKKKQYYYKVQILSGGLAAKTRISLITRTSYLQVDTCPCNYALL